VSLGWIKLHRKLLESEMYRSLNSKQRDVMVQCLLLANHSPNRWEFDGEIYNCAAGQFVTSLDTISRNCAKDVKVQSVRTALLKLEKWHFLTNKSTKTGRLITIINWDTYQGCLDDTNKDTNKQLTKHQQSSNKELTANNNDKNEKNEKNIEMFNQFWNLYPVKKGKKNAEKKFLVLAKDKSFNFDFVMTQLKKQTQSSDWTKDNYRFTPHPTTWLNGEKWNDEIETVPQQDRLRTFTEADKC